MGAKFKFEEVGVYINLSDSLKIKVKLVFFLLYWAELSTLYRE